MPKQPIRPHFRQLKKAQNSKQEGEGKKKRRKIYLDTVEEKRLPMRPTSFPPCLRVPDVNLVPSLGEVETV